MSDYGDDDDSAVLAAQIARVQSEISSCKWEIQELNNDIDHAVTALSELCDRATDMSRLVADDLKGLNGRLNGNAVDTRDVHMAIDNVSRRYFRYRSEAQATRALTQDTARYYKQFGFYNRLRRVSLGSVMAVDSHLIVQDTARKIVEKEYLKNTDYWLAYATMAVMLWWTDEREAAERARNRALRLSETKASLFFLFVCLRFGRSKPAAQWYDFYLRFVQLNDVGDEFQYLLEAQLSGAFDADATIAASLRRRMKDLNHQLRDSDPTFDSRVARTTLEDMRARAHVTEFDFYYLAQYCPAVPDLKRILSDAEKNEVAAQDFDALSKIRPVRGNTAEKLEDSIYDVINSMDEPEEELYRRIRRNELIVKARGDVAQAQKAYDERYPKNRGTSYADLLMRWAFAEDDRRILPQARRWAIGQVGSGVRRGMDDFAAGYRGQVQERYEIDVDGWKGEYAEYERDQAVQSFVAYFEKNRTSMYFKDTYVRLLIAIAAIGVVLLLLSILAPLAPVIVIGALELVFGGVGTWLRIVSLRDRVEHRRLKDIEIISNTLAELGAWRRAFRQADAQFADLEAALDILLGPDARPTPPTGQRDQPMAPPQPMDVAQPMAPPQPAQPVQSTQPVQSAYPTQA